MNVHKEAEAIAKEIMQECNGDRDTAFDLAHEHCDGHEIAIYYHKGIKFCAEHDTSDGEQWLEDCGGIAQPGDSFGQIACRIAFATLLCAVQSEIDELVEAAEEALHDGVVLFGPNTTEQLASNLLMKA